MSDSTEAALVRAVELRAQAEARAEEFLLRSEKLKDTLAQVLLAFKDCIEEYEYASKYKGIHLGNKHGDKETAEEFRSILAEAEKVLR